MFVASRVESGDERKAVAAVLPQFIGNIQTAIGCGTLTRASGIAIQVMVGDPVCQGDVIETAADGRIGIRFIDGTVFNLSRGTRVVLNEFVCDSDGTPNSALFAVTRGTFALVAGQLAKTGSLKVDTPVGSIRGRTHAGGFGMLSLTALTFSMMSEVQAADPNATFLDDDSITYKDLEHGVFELVTKEAIPRHIIVADPGETVVVGRIGSSVSVNQVTNSATRMEELQAAQQDVLANLAKGQGPNGSSTPYFFNPQPLQPINYIQTEAPPPLNSLPPVLPIEVSVPEIIIVHPPPPPPTLEAATGPIEIDTVVFDTFTASSGTFVASSPRSGATLTFGISGGTAGSTVLGGVTYDVSETGPYGTLFVNSTSGAYTFVPDSAAINALSAPTTESFIVTVSDGTLSASQTFTVTINGTNDAAIISGTTTGSVIEAGGVANATPGTPTATGTLTDTDVDNPPNTFTAVSSPKASAGGYGTFTMTAAGVWTYTLDNANSAVQALNAGDTLTDTFTVTTIDGTAQVVTITIHGANDAAIISGTTAGSVIEAGGATPGTPVATGTLTDTDVDNTPNTFTAVSSPTASAGGYGTFTMTAAGVWTYTLDNANSTVDALNVGDTLTDTFTVTTIDGTAQVVTITIHGASDADPNDFDNLATGTVVTSDPPFVFGTPGHDSVAGGGDVPQIIYGGAGDDTLNGTGVNDIIYGGSGNDTIKGNNGDDTIYGGSGNDTINGSNGNDTIIGGFGADLLTGGNGNDRFVYLSVADSRAGQFDTITDFTSGSDKIDLTALGALAFLALDSASTSVPAHTIAWLYDSASNETIVYVNPTDQTLSIGNSALLEIHLQGIATILASDFVYEPTTAPVVVAAASIDLALAATAGDGTVITTTAADVSSDSTVSASALIADGSWTLQAADEGFSFHAARDQTGSIGFTSFGEAWTHSTEYTDGDAVITLASGPSIEPHRAHAMALMEDHFTFDQKPVHDNAGAMTIGEAATMPPSGTINHTDIPAPIEAAELQHAEHGVTPEGGSGRAPFHSESNNGSETSSIATLGNNDHSESVLPNDGSAHAAGAQVDHLEEAGAPGLGDSFHFKNEVVGPEHSDVVDLADVGHTPASIGHGENTAGPHGPPGISETQTVELGPHSADHSNNALDHGAAAAVTHVPHDLIV